MVLKNKVAVVYGGGGVIGGAVARAFAQAGAELYLAGRTHAKLDAVARDVNPIDPWCNQLAERLGHTSETVAELPAMASFF